MKIYFDTLGCLKNTNDSEIAAGYLRKDGHEIVRSPEEADVIIVNTCGFIEDAKRESISEIFEMARYRKEGKKLFATGCLVQRYAMELYREMPEVDGFLGVNDYAHLSDTLRELEKGRRPRRVEEYTRDGFARDSEVRIVPEGSYTTSIRIAEGCDNGCTYCAIPKIRGPYRSRPLPGIVREAGKLAAGGVKELLVIAEDTGCYGKDLYGQSRLPELLRQLSAVEGLSWIRLMYCYEEHITKELLDVMAREPKICPYIDIPLQHISGRILRAMRRASTPASIRAKIRLLREYVPDIALRTTLIVGFPGETEEDFEELMDFVRETKFERLGAFPYSREEGTPAADLPDQVPEDVKQERLDRLMTLQMEISREKNEARKGRTLDVMVDGLDEDGITCVGRTIQDAPEIDDSVLFSPIGKHRPGEIVRVKILDAFDYDLEGMEV